MSEPGTSEAGTTFRHVIDGEAVDSLDGSTFETVNPHTGQPYARVAEGKKQDAERAIAAARKAFDEGPWPRMSTAERRKLLNRLADAFEERAESFARAETVDVGKPVTESLHHDMPRVARNLRFFADFQDAAMAEAFPMAGYHTFTAYEPKGVVAAISPWNFPLMLASWKFAPAIAFGNTCILKPAEQSPATASMFGELAAEILPPGVLNVVQGFGPDAAGEALTRSPDVDLITFTGESGTGATIMAAAAKTLKGVSMEMGGKSPNIVFADADLDAAVAGTIRSIFTNQGEVCLAGSRLYVERPVFDEFVARLADRAAAMVIGDPLDPATQVGPLVSEEHRAKVEGYLAFAEEDGGKAVSGGRRPDPVARPDLQAGFYLEPTILTGLTQQARCTREEIFGPVLVAQPFDTEAEVIGLANDSPYGLAGMVWTQNLARAHRVATSVKAGMIWVNCFFVRDLRTPFGGAKRSGIGREGGYHSREFFTEAKTITMALS
jgi:aminomuconate-semialdehyde/2-hydroxymuconate-6-semialdehyde dehydrogenase